MDYFCYISKNKVDQLFGNISPKSVEKWKEVKAKKNEFGGEASAGLSLSGILDIFKGSISYGRQTYERTEKEITLHITEKLRNVLLSLAEEDPIPSLEDAIKSSNFKPIYYYHKGSFRVEHPTQIILMESIVTILTQLSKGELYLDCSARFFSEGGGSNIRYPIHSGNFRFFSGSKLTMETVFIMLNKSGRKIYGSPIFLKLSSVEEDGFPVMI